VLRREKVVRRKKRYREVLLESPSERLTKQAIVSSEDAKPCVSHHLVSYLQVLRTPYTHPRHRPRVPSYTPPPITNNCPPRLYHTTHPLRCYYLALSVNIHLWSRGSWKAMHKVERRRSDPRPHTWKEIPASLSCGHIRTIWPRFQQRPASMSRWLETRLTYHVQLGIVVSNLHEVNLRSIHLSSYNALNASNRFPVDYPLQKTKHLDR